MSKVLALVGGLDPTGGAGLLRDYLVARERAPELELRAVCTASTRQGHGRPASVLATNTKVLVAELERLTALSELAAVKLGMIPSGAAAIVAKWLTDLRVHPQRPTVVFDPVMVASDGGRLGATAEDLLALARHVDLLTPNLAELETFGELGVGLDALPTALLIKGEQSSRGQVRDRLCIRGRAPLDFVRPRHEGPDPRGTGCALATAIACELASGSALETSVLSAITWLDQARRRTIRVAGEQVFLSSPVLACRRG